MHFSTGRSAWHTTNSCVNFSNTVHHAHVQPLTLSTASSMVEVLRLRSKFRQVGVDQTRKLCLSFGQNQSATGSAGFAICRADISHITHKHSKDMCRSVPQRPELSAVRYRPIAAQNCIFIAIIDYLKLWSEEEMILFNKA